MVSSSKLRLRRRERQRFKIRTVSGGKLRLSIHRTNQHTYAQIIDDAQGITLAAASTTTKEARAALKNGGNKEAAVYVGKIIAEIAKSKGIESVVFDRSGFLYHGRVKEIADSARAQGLKF